MSLSLYTVIAEHFKSNPAATAKPLPEQCILQCTGRLSARVALLQSPILSAAKSFYIRKGNFRGLPFDKPHTCPSVVFFFWLLAHMRCSPHCHNFGPLKQ